MRRARAFFFACAGLLCLALGTAVQAAAATVAFVSDTSWEAFDFDPLSGGTSLGQAQYVCLNVGCPSSCPAGATSYGYACGYWGADLSAIPGAHWVWKPGIDATTVPADLALVCLAKTLTLNGVVTSATISVAADDYAEVHINGEFVGSVGSVTDYGLAAGAQGALATFDAAPYLVCGSNQLVVCAQNGPSSYTGLPCNPCNYAQNPAGVVFGGAVELDQSTGLGDVTWGHLKVLYR
jgi:hypothetical protein